MRGERASDEDHPEYTFSTRRRLGGWYHTCMTYHLSLHQCGVSLFGNMSSYWEAIVDTGTAGLVLPTRMFDSLLAWVPAIREAPAEPWDPASQDYLSCNARPRSL